MSLKALAEHRLAILRGGETPHETTVKQMKQGDESCFTEGVYVPPLMKHGEPQKTAKNDACFTVSRPSTGNSETDLFPPAVAAGLERLRSKRAPHLARPENWSEVVADALRLASEGWAQQALALGWEVSQLFGCAPQVGGDCDLEGLAVKLGGRRIVLLDEATAIMESDAGTHLVFARQPMDGAVLLWDLGSKAND